MIDIKQWWNGLFSSPEIKQQIRGKDIKQSKIAEGLSTFLSTYLYTTYKRTARFKEYEYMMEDSILMSAIEMIAEDACQVNFENDNKIVWITTESTDKHSKDFVLAANRFIDRVGLNQNLPYYTYNTCYLGETPIKIVFNEDRLKIYADDTLSESIYNKDLSEVKKKKKLTPKQKAKKSKDLSKLNTKDDAIVGLLDNVHPIDVFGIEKYGKLLAFAEINASGDNLKILPAWSYVQFILKNRTLIPKVQRMTEYQGLSEEYSIVNSKALIETARRPSKQLRIAEDMMLFTRLINSQRRNIFSINTGTLDLEQAGPILDIYREALSRDVAIDLDSGDYKDNLKQLAIGQDIFLPKARDLGGVEIEQLGGEADVQYIVDIEYYKNKVFGAIRVLKQYLGFEDGLNGRNTAMTLDIRQSKTIRNVQRAMIQTVKNLIHIWYSANTGVTAISEMPKFKVNILSVATVEDKERNEMLSDSINIVNDILNMLTDNFEDSYDKNYVFKYLLNSILKINLDQDKMWVDTSDVPLKPKPKSKFDTDGETSDEDFDTDEFDDNIDDLMNDFTEEYSKKKFDESIKKFNKINALPSETEYKVLEAISKLDASKKLVIEGKIRSHMKDFLQNRSKKFVTLSV